MHTRRQIYDLMTFGIGLGDLWVAAHMGICHLSLISCPLFLDTPLPHPPLVSALRPESRALHKITCPSLQGRLEGDGACRDWVFFCFLPFFFSLFSFISARLCRLTQHHPWPTLSWCCCRRMRLELKDPATLSSWSSFGCQAACPRTWNGAAAYKKTAWIFSRKIPNSAIGVRSYMEGGLWSGDR